MAQPQYYVYSIEGGYSPHNPYHVSNNLLECETACTELGTRFDVNAYVVDRKRMHHGEVFMHKSSAFQREYESMLERLNKLKNT
jgi:hypothetical protein